ncbi:fructosamine kinase family protein [Bacteroidota bacterium]
MLSQINKIEEILGEKISSYNSVGGGCIADAQKIVSESGKTFFYKSYSGSDRTVLLNEANGLVELAKPNTIRVPKVIYYDNSFILIEFIASGSRRRDFSEIFGRQFASLHKYTNPKFGFFENNYIGATPQINLPITENWIDFFWNNRLLFQYKLAEKNGYVNHEFRESFKKLEVLFPQIISGSEEHPSLLHGDLWGGNYMVDENGNPVLIDPAVYYGHREADLAMTHLFGGFDSRFYSAYKEFYPLPAGYEYRNDIYMLYHVLNHLNIFGSGYYSHTISIIRSYTK